MEYQRQLSERPGALLSSSSQLEGALVKPSKT